VWSVLSLSKGECDAAISIPVKTVKAASCGRRRDAEENLDTDEKLSPVKAAGAASRPLISFAKVRKGRKEGQETEDKICHSGQRPGIHYRQPWKSV
jgi:hypothetical protein